jgi:hypothetical protein
MLLARVLRFASLFLCFSWFPALADQVVVTAVRDNTLFADSLGLISNGSGVQLFAGNNAMRNTRRGLIAFEISDHVPAGAVIQSVQLRLHVSNAPNSTLRTFTLHRVLRAWGEGASISNGGRGAASEPGDATWVHRFYPDSLWTTAGGDFQATPIATAEVGGLGSYTWSGPGLVSDVQALLTDPETNFGWLLRGDEEEPSTVRGFDTRESGIESNRPALLIDFDPTETAIKNGTWSRVKQLYRNRLLPPR